MNRNHRHLNPFAPPTSNLEFAPGEMSHTSGRISPTHTLLHATTAAVTTLVCVLLTFLLPVLWLRATALSNLPVGSREFAAFLISVATFVVSTRMGFRTCRLLLRQWSDAESTI